MFRGHDVRALANLILDECDKSGIEISNLQLNKVLYFMHVDWMREFSEPLVSAKIEAWKYGPVFREIFNQFKDHGRQIIKRRATKVDYDTGEKVIAKLTLDGSKKNFAHDLARFYSGMPAGLLVDMSHAKGGAWDVVWNHDGEFNIGMEITNEIIREYEIAPDRIKRRSL